MKCPLCDMQVPNKYSSVKMVPWADRTSHKELGEEEWIDLYLHCSTWECSARLPICSVCELNFSRHSQPWKQYVLHHKTYGHMPDREHTILALMEHGT
jgi:hypothetical protein